MPILAGIFSKKDKHTRHIPPSKSLSPAPVAPSASRQTLRLVDDGDKAHAPAPFNSAPSIATDYVLPEISLVSAENGGFDDAISITASSSSAHPPNSSGNPYTQPVASASSSMLRLVNPFRKKTPSGDSQTSNVPSSPLLSEQHEAFLAPLRNSIFGSLEGNDSSQSLPTDLTTRIEPYSPPPFRPQPPASRTLPLPIPKTPEIRTSTAIKVFNHNTKPSHSSKPSQQLQITSLTQPAPQVDDSTFTLKSFRQIRPESPSPLEPPQFPSSTVGVGPRPRGLSNASDTSQRMTVAAFREAQSRSRTSSLIPDHASDGMPPGNVPLRPASPAGSGFGTPPRPTRQLPPSSFGRNSPTPSVGRGRTQSPAPTPGTRSQNQSPAAVRTPAPRTQSRLSNHRWAQNTSSEDETSSEEDDEGHATITKTTIHGGGKEQTTVTQRGVNELGFGGRPPLRNATGGSSSSSGHGRAKSEHGHGHSRGPSQEQQWPTASKSELGHGALLSRVITPGTSLPSSFSRGSFMPPAHPKHKGAMAETETSENESSESSDEDIPLSTLIPPRRPGSAMSGARSASPAASARSVPSTPNFLSTPQSTHSRTPNSDAIGTLDQAGRGREPLVNLAAPIQKDTGKPLRLPTAPATKKTSPLRSKRSFKDVGNGPAPSASSSSSPSLRPSLPNSPSAVHRRQPSSTNTAETVTRSTIQAGILSSAKVHTVPLKSAESVPRFMVPQPFAHTDSPPSSIGNSSWSGMLPLTPQTGSEAGSSSTSGSGYQEDEKVKDRRKRRVSFAEPEQGKKGEKKAKGVVHRREESDSVAEDKRKERRKSEARAAIELGKIVNGPAPVVGPEETQQPFITGAMTVPVNQSAMNNWEMMQMQQYLQTPQMQPQLGVLPGLSVMPPTPVGLGQFNFSNPMMHGLHMGGLGMPNFGLQMPQMPPMPGAMDPMMLAHQQALLMAKQAYQFAVAQQAMQAAGDEWERASNMGGYSSPFPAAPASMYAGSVFGVPSGNAWGGGSAYARGPGSTLGYSFPMAGSETGGSTALPTGKSASGPGPQPQQTRQRTKTAPSSSQPPAHLRGAGAPPLPPPSSWKSSR